MVHNVLPFVILINSSFGGPQFESKITTGASSTSVKASLSFVSQPESYPTVKRRSHPPSHFQQVKLVVLSRFCQYIRDHRSEHLAHIYTCLYFALSRLNEMIVLAM